MQKPKKLNYNLHKLNSIPLYCSQMQLSYTCKLLKVSGLYCVATVNLIKNCKLLSNRNVKWHPTSISNSQETLIYSFIKILQAGEKHLNVSFHYDL